jgi:DNA-binding response OmpR family regulator
MNIACCTRDPLLDAQVAEWLASASIAFERFRDMAALMRGLRRRSRFELALIDIGHEPTVAERVLSWLHCRRGETMPVILMSSHWNGGRVAQALEAGADDCIARPVECVELLARIRAVLRRSGMVRKARMRIEWAGFTLDKTDGTLLDRGEPVRLTPREFALAWLFFGSPGQCIGRDAISHAVWGADKDVAARTIEQHVYKLRRKIRLGEARGVMIRTSYGQGYRLEQCGLRAWSSSGRFARVAEGASIN